MTGPSWLAAVLAAVAIAISCFCAFRFASACRRRRVAESDGDAVHVVMGVAMAGMLVPGLSLLPTAAWTAVFSVAAAWFAAQSLRGLRVGAGMGAGAAVGGGADAVRWRSAHPLPHLVECAAMICMLAATPGPMAGAAMRGMPAHRGPDGSLLALAVVLAIFMIGYVLWTADQLTSQARAASLATRAAEARAAGSALAPVLRACSKIAMGLTMGYMLLAML